MTDAGIVSPEFWRAKRVLLTGHTGFKGGWLALWLTRMGARVSGLALPPATTPSLYDLLKIDQIVPGGLADLRDRSRVGEIVAAAQPDIVLHLAAQPLVRRSVAEPVETFDINVTGTLNLLEAIRIAPVKPRVVLVVTTDKVYENPETSEAFAEDAPLGGHDPYSSSKAAVELLCASYRRTYFTNSTVVLATARGGNVIGGGDFSQDRIVPDVVRSLAAGEPVVLRNPGATRPWQHALDCLAGYLLYAEALAADPGLPRALNFGPEPQSPVTVAELVDALNTALGSTAGWVPSRVPQAVEMQTLALDSSQARQLLGWTDRLAGRRAIEATAGWYLSWRRGNDMHDITMAEIAEYTRS